MINVTQLVVRMDKSTIEWLERQGYKNPSKLPNSYRFPVFIVDTASKTFFGTNATCMAAAVSSGNKPIVLEFNRLKEKLK